MTPYQIFFLIKLAVAVTAIVCFCFFVLANPKILLIKK